MFVGRSEPLSDEGLDQAADELGVGLPALWAVMTVETRGCGFLPDRRPKILFERHIFSKRTGGRFDAVEPDVSNRKAGGYGPDGPQQYERLEQAMALDAVAALESASWGLGQVMGFNAGDSGYSGVREMVEAMCDSEDAQFGAMVGYVKSNDLARHLQRGEWADFAYRYNGPDFQKNKYDTKLENAFARYSVGPLPDIRVRAAQLRLIYLGYNPGGVDGWFGQNSQKALLRFQQDSGLAQSGFLDDTSINALAEATRR
jgi:hypothetical protein